MEEVKQYRVTEWFEPGRKLNSEYGVVTWQTWCDLELERCGKGYRLDYKGAKVALFRIIKPKEKS